MSIDRPESAPPAVPATTAPHPKLRKPPPKVRAAIEALVTGQVRTITAAAKKSAYRASGYRGRFQSPTTPKPYAHAPLAKWL